MKQIVIELSDDLYDFMTPKNEVCVMDANFVENFIKLQKVIKNGKPLPKEQMTVRQVLELLSNGTEWRLVGARRVKGMMTRNELMDLMPREHKTAEIIEVNKYLVVIRVTCPCCGKVFELESKRNIPMKED